MSRHGTDARHLTLVRHAQADPAPTGASDEARGLSGRGRRDAAALAVLLADTPPEGVPPIDRVLCSAARRTRETFDLLVPGLGGGTGRAAFERALYLASADTLRRRADAAFAEGARHVLIVGHNPGLEQLCARMTGVPGLGMPTCTRLVLRLAEGAADDADAGTTGNPAGGATDTDAAVVVTRDVARD